MSLFHPLDTTGARLHRRLVMRMWPLVTAFTRYAWKHSKSIHSLDAESTWLWTFIWKTNRHLFCLPRTRSWEVQVQMTQTVRMCLDLSRLNDAVALCFGIGEYGIGYTCRLFCRPESIILDVGANVGSTTLAFAEMVPRGHVHSFEPSAAMRSALLSNIRLSNLTNVTVYPFGLADSHSVGRLQIAMNGNPGSAYFVSDQRAEVELRSLDEVLPSIRPVDFVKIDVEGYEKYVLMGGQQLLSRDKPAIVVEINETALQRAGSCSQAVFDLLGQWGYGIWGLRKGRFYEYDRQTHRPLAVHNVLALHPGNARIWQILEDQCS